MYFLFGLLFILCILFFILFYRRRKRLIHKVCCMDYCEKYCLLNELFMPFGFSYSPSQDLITSTLDAWQREFGYQALFDRTAPYFNMVFDCEPIYFNYQGQTWLIELWKGQYGINIGGEIGIYQADRILSPEEYRQAQFHSIPNEQMLPLSMKMFFRGNLLFAISRTHWWLTGFRLGAYCEPEDLAMDVSVTFPDDLMLEQFIDSLLENGYPKCGLRLCGRTLSFTFAGPYGSRFCKRRRPEHLLSRFSQLKNRLFCRLFLLVTRPFTCTADRILYLYYFLPPVFRRMFRFRRNRNQRPRRKYTQNHNKKYTRTSRKKAGQAGRKTGSKQRKGRCLK